ncbi:hypothetical protein CAPTEDRAFT_227380 [Capitella teleta]|uniref:CUE domain-containing protein n=1 Tax=Capitella teleta TaxID=283909 RepID=R7UBC5_CAPTE|nr:hypothetical protein CAPTEDRAFT_227380 [Capitella teleta]|eukprot:ELU03289.1 hypothetical protein CAPTEDRAFT_227380 [Capitella teleta]
METVSSSVTSPSSSADQLLRELHQRFPELPDDVVRRHMHHHDHNRERCLDSLQQFSRQNSYQLQQQQHLNVQQRLQQLNLHMPGELPPSPFSRMAPANRSLPNKTSVSAASLTPFVGHSRVPQGIQCHTGSSNGMNIVHSVSTDNSSGGNFRSPPQRSVSEQVSFVPPPDRPPQASGYHFPEQAWQGSLARARSHDPMSDTGPRPVAVMGPPPLHRLSDPGDHSQQQYTAQAFIQIGRSMHSPANPPGPGGMYTPRGPSDSSHVPPTSSPQVPFVSRSPYGWPPTATPQRPRNLLTSDDPELSRLPHEPLTPSTPEKPQESDSDSSRAASTEDMAYKQALVMYQKARLLKLTQDLEQDHILLKVLRKEVTDMEAQGHDVQQMREANRQMQIDIQILAHEIDLINNGQIKLGFVDQSSDDQSFYRHIPRGPRGSVYQPVNPVQGEPTPVGGATAASSPVTPAQPPSGADDSLVSSPCSSSAQRRRTPPPRPPPPNPPVLPQYPPNSSVSTHPPPPPYHPDIIAPPPIVTPPPLPPRTTEDEGSNR